MLARARQRGVGLRGMSPFRSTRATVPPQLVVGFGNTSARAIEAGIGAVVDLLQ